MTAHFFEQLRPEIEANLAACKILPSRLAEVDQVVEHKLLRFVQQDRYAAASSATGVPVPFMAASFEREASSDFTRSPAQGDPLDEVSTHVPKGLGPYLGPDAWTRAAEDAYRIDGLDKVGAANWTWALGCYYGEAFNGWGYRDWHRMRTPYLWGATNLQQRGKYEADGRFNASMWDEQLGMVPLMMRLVEMVPGLTFPGAWPFPEPMAPAQMPPETPAPTPIARVDVFAVQRALNAKGFGPLVVDGSFGKHSSRAFRDFETSAGLPEDGMLDQAAVDRLLAA